MHIRSLRALAIVAAALATLTAPSSANADAVVYPDRTGFGSAYPGVAVEGFEGGIVAEGGSVACPSVVSASSPCFNGALDLNLVLASFSSDGSELRDMRLAGENAFANPSKLLTTSEPEQFFAFAFIDPATGNGRSDVKAVGFDVYSDAPSECYWFASDLNAELIVDGSVPCDSSGTFVGFDSDEPVGVIGIFGGAPLVGADDIAYALAEPGVDTALAAHPAVLSTAGPAVTLTLSATLTTSGGDPVAGAPVQFSIGTAHVCTGLTDAAGKASCGGLNEAVNATLAGGYTAVFPGGDGYNGSAATGAIIA